MQIIAAQNWQRFYIRATYKCTYLVVNFAKLHTENIMPRIDRFIMYPFRSGCGIMFHSIQPGVA